MEGKTPHNISEIINSFHQEASHKTINREKKETKLTGSVTYTRKHTPISNIEMVRGLYAKAVHISSSSSTFEVITSPF